MRLTDLRRIDPDRPDNWSAILESIELGLRERGLDESTISDQLDDITRDREDELDTWISLDAEIDECTWTDRKGSFEGRSDPRSECVEELANYLVELSCEFAGSNAENVIAHAISQTKSWLQANNLLAFVRTDLHQCPRIGGAERRNFCSGLANWFAENPPDGENGGRIPVSQQVEIRDNWLRLKDTRRCDLQ